MKPPGGRTPRYLGKVVCVDWDDASYDSDACRLDDIDEGYRVMTYGLCIRQTKKGLTVSTDVVEDGRFRHTHFAPWGMILGVKIYGGEYRPKVRGK